MIPQRFFNDLDKESESSPVSYEEIEAYLRDCRKCEQENNLAKSVFNQGEYTCSHPKPPQQSSPPQPAVRSATPRFINLVRTTKAGAANEKTPCREYTSSFAQKVKCRYHSVNSALTQLLNPIGKK